jgi:hypothetical protein
MKVYVVAFCSVLLATPALAHEPGSAGGNAPGVSNASEAPESANHQADGARQPRQICRRIESDTSRRIGSRLVCHTAEEWRAIQNAS